MGRWQREALTEGQGRYRRGPSTTCFASGPPPHGFATGRIERNSRSTRDFPAFEQRRDDLFDTRSEENTSELQSLMRTSYAVFCLKKKNPNLHSPSHRPLISTQHHPLTHRLYHPGHHPLSKF